MKAFITTKITNFYYQFWKSTPMVSGFVPLVLVAYTRTYGKDSLCSNAKYTDLVTALGTIYDKHKDGPFGELLTWYPSLIEKYRTLSIEETTHGKAIIEHIRDKYSQAK